MSGVRNFALEFFIIFFNFKLILNSEAIILSAKRFSESSLIVVVYSKEKGKFSAMAKGALSKKNKFGISLQAASISNIWVYWKENRDLQTLSNAELSVKTDKIFLSLEKMSAALAMVEFLSASVATEDPNELIFNLIKKTIITLNTAQISHLQQEEETKNLDESTFAKIVKLHFFIKLYSLLGYGLESENCGVCEKKIISSGGKIAFSVALGSPLCVTCRERNSFRPISFSALNLLKYVSETEDLQSSVFSLEITEQNIFELDEIIMALIRHHIEGMRNLKVAKIVNELN